MPTIDLSIDINAHVDRVYAIAKDVEKFPDFMPDVKELEVMERKENQVVTRWVGVVPKFNVEVKWTEEDTWNDAERTCHFRQLQGDYDHMTGVWKFTESPTGTTFSSTMDYEYNVPVVGPLIRSVIKHLVTGNLQSLLSAIKRRAESTP
jgi:ribosome-associated toxin RatA of RatAB toxin-antitoxin module